MKLTEFMLKEHGQILALLRKFSKSRLGADFKEFKLKQDRHMLGEEKGIFTIYEKGEKPAILKIILEQHEELDKLAKEYNVVSKPKILERINQLMKEHISLEDKEFYPLLSKKLDLKAQEAVISKAKTYILGTIEL